MKGQSFLLGSFFLLSCGTQEPDERELSVNTAADSVFTVKDEHSYSNAIEVFTTHLHLDLDVNFDKKEIKGSATHQINNQKAVTEMIFDVNDLVIDSVILDGKTRTNFVIGEDLEILGAPMTVDIEPGTKTVEIFYSTSPEAAALQWLNPQQTAGKNYPYLFTQGQAVLTRTWIPCQDTPTNRITYSADVTVPRELMAVMSAENPTEKSPDGKYRFTMEHPIPTYLIALAVGDLRFAELGPRTGVYTEPTLLSKCVYEFADVEKMMSVAEGLYGPYLWGRYDIIVLPPSFPFGGMENPCLTFATPTIITGDRSLVSLIAHELAHSWSGNLVTNATWDDFWLNEGFTVYIENRIMEAIFGRERSDMLLSIECQMLELENDDLLNGDHPEDTHLKLNLKGRDPDEGMTGIAYTKGALFLKTVEEAVGRDKFDSFLKSYFADHQFEAVTTEIFVAYLKKNLLEKENVTFNVDEWVYGQGIPANCVQIHSDRFAKVEEKAKLVPGIEDAAELGLERKDWSTQEWMHFIRHLPEETTVADLAALDAQFDFSNCGNAEIQCEWFQLSIEKGYTGINPAMPEFLIHVGRRKFLQPIYQKLSENAIDREIALEIYRTARPNYHSVTFGTIDEILGWEKS